MKNDDNNENLEGIESAIRNAYEGNKIYKVADVCSIPCDESEEYVDRLLSDKLSIVKQYMVSGLVIDLCCATGEHLFSLHEVIDEGMGIDFSRPFITEAEKNAEEKKLSHIRFKVGDAKKLPLSDASVALLYSFSGLYAIPGIDKVFSEISRVLIPEGRCVVELGNLYSLNTICRKAYKDLPPTFHISASEMKRVCKSNNLQIIERRCFQLLPLWADKPRWLWPLLHPVWKKIMSRRIAGKMLDEWVSSLPLFRNFAFRHILVCKKIN